MNDLDLMLVAADPEMDTYLDPARQPYAFCPGCSHSRVSDQLNAALVRLQLDPRQVVIVTDIGCAGITDQYFHTHALHGLHGRSVTYASGIKLARPDLHVIVLVGDGGCGIGGHHLINAARRNLGVTVLVFNNLNFGMTGGQHSVTTPPGSVTSTTPLGTLERPLDIAGTVAVNGAGLVARTTAFDPQLPELIAQAIQYDGFALLDIWELCTAYYVPENDFNRAALEQTMAGLGHQPGLVHLEERPEYVAAYRAGLASLAGQAPLPARPLDVTFTSDVDRPMRLVIAGAAGQRVRTAANLLATGGVLSGLWAAVRDDHPITVRTGFSLAEVILAPEPILYAGADEPDAVALLAPEGVARIRGLLGRLAPDTRVFASDDLGAVATTGRLEGFDLPPAARARARKSLATLAVGRLVRALDLFPPEALVEAVRRTQRAEIAAQNLAALGTLEGEGADPADGPT